MRSHFVQCLLLFVACGVNSFTTQAQVEGTSSTVTFDLTTINERKPAIVQWLSPNQNDRQKNITQTQIPVSFRVKSFSPIQKATLHINNRLRVQMIDVSTRLQKEANSSVFYVLSASAPLDKGVNALKLEINNKAGSVFSDLISVNCVPLEQPIAPIKVQIDTMPRVATTRQRTTHYTPADVDLNLPTTTQQNPHAIAVVIGNSVYKKAKNVKYAVHDAQSIKRYLEKTMGFKPGNIFYLENATKGEFELYFGIKGNPKGKLYNAIKPNKSDVFVYYSGHGAPSIKNKHPYFVPVECDPQYVELGGYSANVFYQNLAQLKARSIAVVLDACFSGSTIYENISPIDIKPKGVADLKNGVVLSSSSGSEVSCWYNDKQHGMFTYFFLKAIHNQNADANKDGQLTFKEIYRYVADSSEGVPYFARRVHGVEQHPTIKGKNTARVLVRYD